MENIGIKISDIRHIKTMKLKRIERTNDLSRNIEETEVLVRVQEDFDGRNGKNTE